MVTEIIIEVTCQGCGEKIAKPSDCDMELWRLGIHIHDKESCAGMLEAKLKAGR